MKLIDTHAHIYLEEFDGDRDEVVQRAADEGVEKIYLPNIDSTTISSMYRTEEKYEGMCHAMMGLHPCYVKDGYKAELDRVYSELSKRKFSAIGEIGIDLYWDKSTYDIQKEAFIRQVMWSLELELPFVIHSRESTDIIIDILKEMNLPFEHGGIFHCFSGTYAQAKEVIDLGLHLGIGGVLTYKNSTLWNEIKDIDLKHIVLETDAPYLTPVPFRGKRNESSYVRYVAQSLAEKSGISYGEVCLSTTKNAKGIFVNS